MQRHDKRETIEDCVCNSVHRDLAAFLESFGDDDALAFVKA
ncbi:MAG: hypothetical protein ABR526_03095 [Chthoniobacterales bacterium]